MTRNCFRPLTVARLYLSSTKCYTRMAITIFVIGNALQSPYIKGRETF